MGLTVPDKGEGADNLQSVWFQETIEVILDGIDGKNCVLSGGLVTTSSLLTVSVAKAAVISNGTMFAVASATKTLGTADVTNPRLDFIVVDSSGALQVRAGTAAANPKPPVRSTNDVVLAIIYVPALLTTVVSGDITDMRVLRTQGPILIYKTTAAETTNTATTVELLNKANAGVTIPSGLFLNGRIIRVVMGGNMLLNSGTGVDQLDIRYGGTTMYNFSFPAQVASASRCAWWCHFDVVAQANADQSMAGTFQISSDPGSTRATPGTGIGVISQNTILTEGLSSFSGSAAVDSDAANRLLSVLWTMASNAANEVVVEYASVEIL